MKKIAFLAALVLISSCTNVQEQIQRPLGISEGDSFKLSNGVECHMVYLSYGGNAVVKDKNFVYCEGAEVTSYTTTCGKNCTEERTLINAVGKLKEMGKQTDSIVNVYSKLLDKVSATKE